MSTLPWVRFFPSDWLAGTRGMSAAEMGVYISLISMMYERGEPISEDTARLARLCGASNSSFKTILATLVDEGKIARVEGGLWNARVEKEQVYRSEKSEVGKQAAEKRWQKTKRNQQPADADAMPAQCERNANQKPEPEKKKEPPTASPKKGSRLPDEFAPDLTVATSEGLTISEAEREALKFRDYWRGVAGSKGVKLDWPATWRNWVRSVIDRRSTGPPGATSINGYRRTSPQRRENGTGSSIEFLKDWHAELTAGGEPLAALPAARSG